MGEMVKYRHWIESIIDRLVKNKKPPFIIAAAITTSGPPHLGTVCEFLYPWAIVEELKSKGYDVYFVFIGDIMDAFDNIPATLRKYENVLRPHLGKPLVDVPDPYGCHDSYGEHFLDDTKKLMYKLNVYPDEVIPASKLYMEGWYDYYLEFFIENLDNVKRILEEVSMRKLPKDWKNIVLPVCEKCGKIATTRVVSVDVKEGIRYKCDRDVGYTKGCGHEGVVSIESHRWKLMWRLDWPSRQDFLGVDCEGGGVDHFTQGGSWDTAVAIHTKLFKKEPPIGYKYGFILIGGRKMSKSKGLGAVEEIVELLPPEVIKYFIFKHEIEENKDFRIEPGFLLRLYEEFQNVADLYESLGLNVDRAYWKKVYAYKLSTNGVRKWKSSFSDILVYYQIYRDWDIVCKKLDDCEGVKYLSKYIEKWIEKGFIPETYRVEYNPQKPPKHVEAVKDFIERLKPSMRDIDIHNLVYEVAKSHNINHRELFKSIYYALLGKDCGPRVGRLIVALGIDRVKNDLLKILESSP